MKLYFFSFQHIALSVYVMLEIYFVILDSISVYVSYEQRAGPENIDFADMVIFL